MRPRKKFIKKRSNLYLLRGEDGSTDHTIHALRHRNCAILRQTIPKGRPSWSNWDKGIPYAAAFPIWPDWQLKGHDEVVALSRPLAEPPPYRLGKMFPNLEGTDWLIGSAGSVIGNHTIRAYFSGKWRLKACFDFHKLHFNVPWEKQSNTILKR